MLDVTGGATGGAASIPSRIVRAAWRSKSARCSLPLARVGLGEAHACERRLVRGADLVPESHRFGEGLFRARRIAVGEPHPSASEGGAGGQRFALEPGGDELQLVGGRSGPADVAGRDLDLDLRLEQRRALQVGVRWSLLRRHPQGALEGVSDGGGRGGHVSLGQTHQRETRLGIPPGAMSGQQRFLRAGDVSLVESDPSELVERPPELASQVRAQFLAGHERLRSPPRCTTRAAGGSRRGGPGSARGGCRWRSSRTTAPSPRSTPRPRRTGRGPAARTRARSRRPPSRADRGPRRRSPPRPRRAAPDLAGHRRPG